MRKNVKKQLTCPQCGQPLIQNDRTLIHIYSIKAEIYCSNCKEWIFCNVEKYRTVYEKVKDE